MGLIFFDTTSIYFEGGGGQNIGRHGHSKDHRPDLRQMVVGVALDVRGRPICCEMWPGTTRPLERMRAKFRVREMCVVADRGMVTRRLWKPSGGWSPRYITSWVCACAAPRRSARWCSRAALAGRKSLPSASAPKIPLHSRSKILALVLKRELEIRMEEKGLEAEWAEVVRGLDNLQQVELFLQGSRFRLRSQLKGNASQAIRAAEVALPSRPSGNRLTIPPAHQRQM